MSEAKEICDGDERDRHRQHGCGWFCVVLLCGLPGVGKTTLARRLVEDHHAAREEDQEARAVHICYDAIMAELQRARPSPPPHEKEEEEEEEGEDFNAELWQKARQVAYDRAESLIQEHRQQKHLNRNNKSVLVLFLDDNFYYRSMRYPFYRLSQQNGGGFLQVCLKAPLEVVLQRNRQRAKAERVPERLIRRMHARFEWPSSSSASSSSWEEPSALRIVELGDADEDAATTVWRWILKEGPVSAERAAMRQAQEERLRMEQKRSQESNLKNLMHQLDLRTRKTVSEMMMRTPSSVRKKELGRRLSEQRKEWLESTRERLLSTVKWGEGAEQQHLMEARLEALESEFAHHCEELRLTLDPSQE